MDLFKVFVLIFLGLVASVNASNLSLQSPKFAISSSQGEQIRSEPISISSKLSPLTLGSSDILKLSFQIVEKDNEKGVQPHQTFLRFYDEQSGEEGIQPLRVAPNGKAKFELNMARPPSSLPPTTEDSPLKVTLIIGSFVHSPAKFDLFDLYVPASQPVVPHPDERTFHPLPPIHHTFRPEQKTPPVSISAVASILVVSPWIALFSLWSNLDLKAPHLFSANILPFTATLVAFEGLLFWYWVDLKLGQVLLYGGILSIITVFTGKNALLTIRQHRTGK